MQKTYKKYFPIFVLPTLIAFIISFIIPFFMGLYLSFCNFKTIGSAKFTGLSNYLYVFSDTKGFLSALWFTVKVAAVGVISTNVLAFALLLNGILIRVAGADLTYSATYGYWGIIILYNWQKIGYLMIIYIAGIQSISGDILEAAKIDGANYVQTLKNIIIPLVMTSITTCTFLALTDCFKMYDQNLALTGGAPADQTTMLAMDIYNTYYNRTGFAGVGQAKAVVFTVLVLVIALIQLRATQSKEAA